MKEPKNPPSHWNDPEVIRDWVDAALDNAKPNPNSRGQSLTEQQIHLLRRKGHWGATNGLLRGDISEMWKTAYPWLNTTMLDLYR